VTGVEFSGPARFPYLCSSRLHRMLQVLLQVYNYLCGWHRSSAGGDECDFSKGALFFFCSCEMWQHPNSTFPWTSRAAVRLPSM
jgi:hypothetical protein